MNARFLDRQSVNAMTASLLSKDGQPSPAIRENNLDSVAVTLRCDSGRR